MSAVGKWVSHLGAGHFYFRGVAGEDGSSLNFITDHRSDINFG